MADVIFLGVLLAVALTYVSVLIYISLRGRDTAPARIRRVLIEMWVTFALIIGILYIITLPLGNAPSGSIAVEISTRIAQWHAVPLLQKVVIIGGSILAIALFAHFILSLRSLQHRRPSVPPSAGGTKS